MWAAPRSPAAAAISASRRDLPLPGLPSSRDSPGRLAAKPARALAVSAPTTSARPTSGGAAAASAPAMAKKPGDSAGTTARSPMASTRSLVSRSPVHGSAGSQASGLSTGSPYAAGRPSRRRRSTRSTCSAARPPRLASRRVAARQRRAGRLLGASGGEHGQAGAAVLADDDAGRARDLGGEARRARVAVEPGQGDELGQCRRRRRRLRRTGCAAARGSARVAVSLASPLRASTAGAPAPSVRALSPISTDAASPPRTAAASGGLRSGSLARQDRMSSSSARGRAANRPGGGGRTVRWARWSSAASPANGARSVNSS